MKFSDQTITSQMIKELETLIETKITHVLGGRKSNANSNDMTRLKIAVEFLHDFYEQYSITGYSEIMIKDFEFAKEYVLKWQPAFNLKLEIELLNQKGNGK